MLPTVRFVALGALVVATAGQAAAQGLFESRRLTPRDEYKGIEGPAVDAAGVLYVVNFQRKGTIGRLKPGAERSDLFAPLPAGSVGNGIRFDRDGRMYVADHKRHNILVFERGQRVARVYFHSNRFNQPNDLAIAADGTLYASDPKPNGQTGQVWRIRRGPDGNGRGTVMSSDRPLGRTNGIDLSPDGKTLYVGESNSHKLWAYRIEGTRLRDPRPLGTFNSDLDGLRTDVDGRIFVARPGNGTVTVLKPNGEVVREVELQGNDPTNLTFGGPDGKTVYVTQADGQFIEAFRTNRPGREPCLQLGGQAC